MQSWIFARIDYLSISFFAARPAFWSYGKFPTDTNSLNQNNVADFLVKENQISNFHAIIIFR